VKRIAVRRPSPATAIACIAMFVALGGVSSYGFASGSIDSREIADNTVRSKDIRNNGIVTRDLRNNEIRAIDIRNNTIRGRDIAPNTLTDDQVDESKLTQVPDAARLGGRLSSEYAAGVPEPVRLIGAEDQPPFAPGVSAAGGDDLDPGFWRDGVGTIHLQGSVDGAGGPIFTLPGGYRPAGTARFRVPAGPGAATLEITPDGDVTVSGADPVSLDGIAFRPA
jgi:hypothetical protein